MGTTKLNVNDVVTAILTGDLDGCEDKLYNAIKMRRREVGAEMLADLAPEDRVQFVESVRGVGGMTGTIDRIARTRAHVLIDDTPVARAQHKAGRVFTVPPSMLRKIEG